MTTPVRDSSGLGWVTNVMGAGRRESSAPPPPEAFYCVLDQLPLHLVPASSFLPKTDLGALVVNPQCSVMRPGEMLPEIAFQAEWLQNFYRQSTIAWVRDAWAGCLRPFWLGPKFEAFVEEFCSGAPAPAGLAEDLKQVLLAAEILVAADHRERSGERWKAMVERGSRSFRENNYAPLRNLIHPFHVAALRRYYRAAIRRGAIRLGDEQSSRRYVAHNDSVARFFHGQLATTVSAIVGEPVKPSYVYLAAYLAGAELKKHTDREQCEFSVTLALDFAPEPQLATPWPIRLETSQGEVAIFQALGDGLVYRGTAVPHYRDALAEDMTSTSLFFHYVPINFSGSLD